MKRKVMVKLLEWRKSGSHRMPMLVYGARQVGKTYVMKELGAETFKNAVYINFEEDRKIGDYFQEDISAQQLIQILENYYNTAIVPDKTLIIFDEIQSCERALTSLKYFAEEAPEYHIIGAGSLLGVALKRKNYSFPVGKVQMLNMYCTFPTGKE